ncbi:hypothetical protein [Streptomyces sp. NPDC048142]|uniref:hypothetical protein n=1 Tax=Streptomyces sp. NPDC048142 TaxID=3365501 RepID=UPI003711F734
MLFAETAKGAPPETPHVLCRSTGRHLLFGSKGVRLLLVGDRVAVRDLRADRTEQIAPFVAGVVVGSPIVRCLRQPPTPPPWSRTPSAFRGPDLGLGATTPPEGT